MHAVSWTLRRLIGCLAVMGLAGVALLGGVYLAGSVQLGRHQAEADRDAVLQERVLSLHNTLLAAHRAEKQFLLRGEERAASEHGTLLRSAAGLTEEVDRLLGGAGKSDLRARLKTVSSGIEAYGRHAKAVMDHRRALGLDQGSGLQGAFRASAHSAEQILAEVDEKELTNVLLTMRRNEKDFQLRGEPRYAERVAGLVASFGRLLDATSVTGPAYDGLKGAVAAYGRDFAAYAERHKLARDEEGSADRAFAAMEPVFDDVRRSVGDGYRAAQDEIAANRSRTTAVMLTVAAAAFSVVGLLGFLITRAVVKPIAALTRSTEQLARGSLDVAVSGVERRDEIGIMARALQVFRDALLAQRNAQASSASEAAARSLRAERLDGLTRDFERTTAELSSTLAAAAARMEATARTMSGAAAVSSQEAEAVAGTAHRTSENVQAVASASEELAHSINEIADQVAASSRIAGQAAGDARRTHETVRKLSVGAQRIGAVVALINDVAAQTNLLALNATIEAARAGEAGRGFAVVASEVKALASQTARATDEIGQQIQEIQAVTAEAVAAIQDICETVGSLDAVAGRIAATMEQQGAATQEISRNVQEAARGTEAVAGSIGRLREAAGQAGAAAEEVLGAAQAVSRQASGLNGEVTGFVAGVKRA